MKTMQERAEEKLAEYRQPDGAIDCSWEDVVESVADFGAQIRRETLEEAAKLACANCREGAGELRQTKRKSFVHHFEPEYIASTHFDRPCRASAILSHMEKP